MDQIFYLGDSFNVHLWGRDGLCLQKLGTTDEGEGMDQFKTVLGICVMDNLLFATDKHNRRIQIFKRG